MTTITCDTPETPETDTPDNSAVFRLEARACPVCHAPFEATGRVVAEGAMDSAALGTFAFASRKLPEYMRYRQVLCRACDLQYASPAPRADAIGAAYTDADFDSGIEAAFAAKTYGSQLKRLLPNLAQTGSALDVGTGDGIFLRELFASGFRTAEGVEPSLAPIRAAAPDLRPLIRQGLFTPDLFQSGERFDLITCFQTIEHLPDPLQFCRDAHALLRERGALFLVCHNRQGLINRALGLRSPIYDIEHLQLFSPTSARRLLTEAGYTNVSAWPIVNRYPLRYWARLFPLPTAPKARLLAALAEGPLGALPISVAVGNTAVVGYRK